MIQASSLNASDFFNSLLIDGASAVSDYLVGPGFPWQLRRLLPDILTLVNVQNSRAPVAVFTRQIDEVPGDDNPLPTWIW
jgi:hypothetical protein